MTTFQATPSQILQRLPTNGRQIELYLRLNNGNGCCVHADTQHQLSALFAPHILKQIGLLSNFRAIYKGQQLKDMTITVKQAGLSHKSIIYLEQICQERERMKIEVGIYHEGETFHLSLRQEDKILTLKHRLYKLIKIPLRKQKLFFRSQQLKNQTTFKEYHITDQSLLCLLNLNTVKINIENINRDDKNWESDSPKMRSTRGSMLERDFQFNLSPVKRGRSLKNNIKEEQLGYEVEIRQTHEEDNELSSCKLHEFDFNFSQLKYPSILQKTQSEDDQNSQAKEHNPVEADSGLSFSQRLMII